MSQVLVIEATNAVRALVVAELQRAALADAVLDAADGHSALALLKQHTPDAILLCHVLPDMSGIELLRTIKALPQQRDVPVVMLSAREDVSDKVDALTLGASDYLIKPIDPRELVARIRVQLKLKHLQDELREANERLQALSITDYLTGLFNRRHFMQLLADEFERSRRYKLPLGVLLADIDLFKQINDSFGHGVGDHALQDIARLLRAGLRLSDTLARYGGEEFVALLPMARVGEALLVAERARTLIERQHFPALAGRPVTISIGCCSYPGPGLNRLDDLLNSADRALYAAKQAGRNRTGVFEAGTLSVHNPAPRAPETD